MCIHPSHFYRSNSRHSSARVHGPSVLGLKSQPNGAVVVKVVTVRWGGESVKQLFLNRGVTNTK